MREDSQTGILTVEPQVWLERTAHQLLAEELRTLPIISDGRCRDVAGLSSASVAPSSFDLYRYFSCDNPLLGKRAEPLIALISVALRTHQRFVFCSPGIFHAQVTWSPCPQDRDWYDAGGHNPPLSLDACQPCISSRLRYHHCSADDWCHKLQCCPAGDSSRVLGMAGQPEAKLWQHDVMPVVVPRFRAAMWPPSCGIQLLLEYDKSLCCSWPM